MHEDSIVYLQMRPGEVWQYTFNEYWLMHEGARHRDEMLWLKVGAVAQASLLPHVKRGKNISADDWNPYKENRMGAVVPEDALERLERAKAMWPGPRKRPTPNPSQGEGSAGGNAGH